MISVCGQSKRNPAYYEEYMENVLQENTVLDVTSEIFEYFRDNHPEEDVSLLENLFYQT